MSASVKTGLRSVVSIGGLMATAVVVALAPLYHTILGA